MPQIAMESPEAKRLFFAGATERPTEAPGVTCKKQRFAEDLEWIAGLGT